MAVPYKQQPLLSHVSTPFSIRYPLTLFDNGNVKWVLGRTIRVDYCKKYKKKIRRNKRSGRPEGVLAIVSTAIEE
ncbi:hypothetical protein CCACVL1_04973 [Corchorus capsularis]|uniref:Uncharacterized protein n=1 Tax=Corchorus capsularis TaxID=210143 RepID=A0A1R3JNV8_COCAP|nr:hypothetical protein CCACVL1_04973 [Corchorus capsularis]